MCDLLNGARTRAGMATLRRVEYYHQRLVITIFILNAYCSLGSIGIALESSSDRRTSLRNYPCTRQGTLPIRPLLETTVVCKYSMSTVVLSHLTEFREFKSRQKARFLLHFVVAD